MAVPISTIHYRTYTETGNSNQNSGFCHFILTRNPANWLVGVSPELSTIHYQLSTLITMLRKFLVLLMCLTLCWTTSACGSSSSTQSQPQAQQNAPAPVSKPLSDGEYPVQQATYNDADGSYSLFLLNTPSGTPPVYNTVDLQMAQLTSEDIEAGKKTYLKVENGQQAMYMKEDFRIEYVHNVTETRTDPKPDKPKLWWCGKSPASGLPLLGRSPVKPSAVYYFALNITCRQCINPAAGFSPVMADMAILTIAQCKVTKIAINNPQRQLKTVKLCALLAI